MTNSYSDDDDSSQSENERRRVLIRIGVILGVMFLIILGCVLWKNNNKKQPQ
ncbi:hypothetical protein MKW92_051243, partial [Papaver armeniacum]